MIALADLHLSSQQTTNRTTATMPPKKTKVVEIAEAKMNVSLIAFTMIQLQGGFKGTRPTTWADVVQGLPAEYTLKKSVASVEQVWKNRDRILQLSTNPAVAPPQHVSPIFLCFIFEQKTPFSRLSAIERGAFSPTDC
jgi:hypothetical protein